jgi:hypothetical protein
MAMGLDKDRVVVMRSGGNCVLLVDTVQVFHRSIRIVKRLLTDLIQILLIMSVIVVGALVAYSLVSATTTDFDLIHLWRLL